MGEKDFQEEVFLGWSPEEACRPIVEEAPVFYPSEEEFKDTLKYIKSIYQKVEAYGICRIVPPSSFKPPCPLKDGCIWGKRKFETRIQEVDKLQNREPARKKPKTRNRRRKRRQSWTMVRRRGHSVRSEVNEPAASDDDDRFGFHPGPEYTLEAFQRYADNFKEQYFRVKDSCKDMCSSDHESKMKKELSVEDIEGEYWRLVEKASEEVEVHYGADLDTEKFCSGFPKANLTCIMDDDPYVSSGWNLNNFARLPGSVLAFEQTDISGVLVPWLYIGMCFSSFCWHVEDHHLYSLNYLHFGDPKLWYGVPGSDAIKLENAMKKHLPELFEEQPTLLNELVTQLSPSVLKSEGVSVYRTVQYAGEFVLTFPRAYHSGFNCGFNCAEAVNVAPVDWLPHGQSAVELYHEQCRKTSISHDKLLLGAADGAVRALWRVLLLKECNKESLRWESACGNDGVLTEAIKARVQMEQVRREKLPKAFAARRMHANFGLTDDQECFLCFYDLHLSASGCECSPNRFSCLEHAKLLCSCDPRKRHFLFRYDLDELHTLVKALEGNLTSLYDWATGKLAIDDSSVTAPQDSCLKPETSCSSFTKSGETGFGTLVTTQSEIAGKVEPEVGPPHADCVKKIKRDLDEFSVDSVATDGISSEMKGSKCNAPKYPSKEGSTSRAKSPKVLDMNEACKSEDGECDSSGGFQSSSVENSHMDSYLVNKLRIINSVEFPSATNSEKSLEIGFIHQELNLGMFSPIKDDSSAVTGTKVNTCKNFSDLVTEGPLSKRKRSTPDGSCISGEKDINVDHNQKQQKSQSSSSSSTESDRSRYTYKVNEEQLLLSEDIDLNSHLSRKCLSAHERDVSNAKGKDEMFIKLKKQMIDIDYSRGGSNPCREHVSMNANSSSLLIDGSLQEGACSKAEKLFGVNLQLLKPSSCESSDRMHVKETTSCTYTITNENKSSSTVAVYPSSGSDTCTFHIEKALHEPGPDVIPLNFGSAVPQKLWSSKEAIFPKGYKSRVKFFDILDPTQICSYTSEVFDAGLLGPMFKVTLEDHPSDVFIHASPVKCWDLVRERLNEEIEKLQGLGVQKLPPLQPPGSLDGFKMFGFSSLQIVESIEALDPSHQCSDYWISKPYQLPSLNWNLNNKPDEQNDCLRTEITEKCDSCPISHAETEQAYSHSRTNQIQSMDSEDDISDMKVGHVLRGLFKKGSREELILMHKVLCSKSCSSSRRVALASLLEEIEEL